MLLENVGKVDSTHPPINPYIELERENPLSLKHWCDVLYGISCEVQILTRELWGAHSKLMGKKPIISLFAKTASCNIVTHTAIQTFKVKKLSEQRLRRFDSAKLESWRKNYEFRRSSK